MNTQRFYRHSLALLSLILVGNPGQAADSTVIPGSPQDQSLLDVNQDGQGDAPGSIRAVEGRVGENQDDAHEVRYCLLFPLSDRDRESIVSAPGEANAITLKVFLRSKLRTPAATVNLLGFETPPEAGFAVTHFAGGDAALIQAQAVTNDTPGGKMVELDVTEFARAQAKKGNQALAFRLELDGDWPNGDGVANRFAFDTADGEHPPYLQVQRP